ncbi:MAG: hypothetical protein ABL997_17335 [Planctomycetota bacterium]
MSLKGSLSAPMAYVAIDASAGGEAGAANPLLTLAMSPAFGEANGGGAFAFVRGVLSRARGEVELALLGVMPSLLDDDRAGSPLVVLRTQLAESDVERLRVVLADERVARPSRLVHGRQAYVLVGSDAEAGRLPIEIALLDRDLVVANNARGLDEALDRGTTTGRRSLVEDARFRRLMADLRPESGALLVYADWLRCGPRLASLRGLPGTLLQWSGLGGADAVAMAVMPRRSDRRAADGGEIAFHSQILLSMPEASAVDGWLSLVTSAPARQMLDDVPVGGLGGFVFSVEPERLIAAVEPGRGPLHRHRHDFGHRIHGGCELHGLDFQRIVDRLGHRGSMQMLLLPSKDFELAPAFALQAKSRKAANDIVDEVARAVRPEGRNPAERTGNSVDLRELPGLEHLHLAVVDDWIVFAQDEAAIAALSVARRDRARVRTQLDSAVQRAVRALASEDRTSERGDRHGGLVHLDLRNWLAQASPALVGSDTSPRSGHVDVPALHTGFVDVETAADGTSATVRLHVLSTR